MGNGLLVSSDLESVGSVPSGGVLSHGFGTVLGGEVLVGSDVSGSDELHVLSDVSHSSGLGFLEGVVAAEERVVGEGRAVVSRLSRGTLGLLASELGLVVAADIVPSATTSPVHEGAVFVMPVVGLSSAPVGETSLSAVVDPSAFVTSVVDGNVGVTSGVSHGESLVTHVVDGSNTSVMLSAPVLSELEGVFSRGEEPSLGSAVDPLSSGDGGSEGGNGSDLGEHFKT